MNLLLSLSSGALLTFTAMVALGADVLTGLLFGGFVLVALVFVGRAVVRVRRATAEEWSSRAPAGAGLPPMTPAPAGSNSRTVTPPARGAVP